MRAPPISLGGEGFVLNRRTKRAQSSRSHPVRGHCDGEDTLAGSLLAPYTRPVSLIHVSGKVARSGARRAIAVRFLVDTGAVFTVLPEAIWRRLRLTSERTAEFTLADGTTITRGVSECRFTVTGRTATSPVVLGGPGDAALLAPSRSRRSVSC